MTEFRTSPPPRPGWYTDFSDMDFYQIYAMFGCLIIIARQCPVAPRGDNNPLSAPFFFPLLGIVGGRKDRAGQSLKRIGNSWEGAGLRPP